jgi:o-succinylbenzoate synthase
MTLEVTLGRARAKLPSGACDATRSWREREAVTIAISDGEHQGRGDAAPLPGLSRDRLDDVERVLARIVWRDVDPDSDDPLSLAARLVPAEVPAARFAVEAALLDLLGRADARPAAAILSQRLGADGPAARIGCAALLDDLDTAMARARAAISEGARALKVKIGRAGRASQEVALLVALRAEIGGAVAIRADANGALERGAKSPLIAALADIGAELLEDPFPVARLLEEPLLPVPVALDESLSRDPTRARAAIDRGLARAVVLKPAVLGGIGAALALAELARERGLRAIVSHAYDSPRSFAASAHLALALGARRPDEVHGLARYDGLDQWRDERGGALPVPTGIAAYRIDAVPEGGLG